jgi:hypothetical protein
MTTGLAPEICNDFLKALFRQTNYTAPTAIWAQKHIGDPGAAGTANIAADATRVECTHDFGTDPTGASITNDAVIGPWDDVPAAEDYTHISLWTAETGGTFILSGTVTANAVAIGDSFDIPVGAFASAFQPAA